jgi:hypothetical protein
LENRIVELENKKIPTMTYDFINVVSTLAEQPTNSGELNAVIFNSAKIPHNIPIKSIEIPITGNTTSEALYLVAYNVGPDNVRSLIARSSNSIIPVSGINAIWQFEESFTILDGHSLAIYIAKENSVIGSSEVNLTDTHINCPQLGSGTDTIRYAANTYGRDVFVKIHTVNSIPLNDKISSLVDLGEENTFTASNTFQKVATFNEGILSNGDIVLNNRKLLLVNDAAIEVYPGEDVPMPEGGFTHLHYYALYKEMTEKLVHNGIYHLNEMESINFALEEELDDLFSCEVVFTSGATPTVVTSDSRIKWVGDDVNAGTFTPIANVRYSCSLQYDGVFVRGMAFGIPTV